MTTQSEALTIRLERELPAPPAAVFRMHADPDSFARWWGPKGFTSPSVELDVRVGGEYRIEMMPPSGDSFVLSGVFRVVDPPRRLAYTFRWEEPDPDDRETLVGISFGDLGGSTRLVIDQGRFATEARRALHEQGWTETLDRLQALLEERGSLDAPDRSTD